MLVREAKTLNNFGNKGYLGFEHVTMVGFPVGFTVCSMLNADSIGYLYLNHLVSNPQKLDRYGSTQRRGEEVVKRVSCGDFGQGDAFVAEDG